MGSSIGCNGRRRPKGGDRMAKSVLYMSMSLDGFITGPDDGPGNGLGTGGTRLHEWLGEPVSELPYFDPPGLSGQVFAEVMATGAVVVGRKTFDYAGRWGGDHHGVPIFVPTRGTPPEPPIVRVHYVPDPATAMHEAKAAAGQQDVMVHGAALAQSLLRESLLDELEIRLIPVVLGNGRRLFGPAHGARADARARRARRHAPALSGGVMSGRGLVLLVSGLDGRRRRSLRPDDRLADRPHGRDRADRRHRLPLPEGAPAAEGGSRWES